MQTEFTIRYDIPDSEIQIDALIDSLTNFKHAINEIHRFHSPSGNIEINIKAIKAGSFLVFLGLYLTENSPVIAGLINKENITITAAILTTLVHSIKLKNHLQGRKANSIEKSNNGNEVTIENQNGQTLIVKADTFNFYNNSTIDSNLSGAFRAAQKEKDLQSLEILDAKDKKLIEVPRSEMKYLQEPIVDLNTKEREVIKTNVSINATKLAWDEKLKWSFVYEGQKINAKITDESFYERINKGEQFAKGDTLKVNLKIKQEFDEDVNSYLNKSFEFVKVNKHIPRPKQMGMEFE